jgi:hypothetical protein
MRLDFSGPPSRKRLPFSSQAPEVRPGYLHTYRRCSSSSTPAPAPTPPARRRSTSAARAGRECRCGASCCSLLAASATCASCCRCSLLATHYCHCSLLHCTHLLMRSTRAAQYNTPAGKPKEVLLARGRAVILHSFPFHIGLHINNFTPFSREWGKAKWQFCPYRNSPY